MRTSVEVLRDIANFYPTGGAWLALEGLLDELWPLGVVADSLPILFGVFERFPKDDGAGVLWSIVHGVESLPIPYRSALLASYARAPSEMGRIMLDRLARSGDAV
jgi:hypothetical protein